MRKLGIAALAFVVAILVGIYVWRLPKVVSEFDLEGFQRNAIGGQVIYSRYRYTEEEKEYVQFCDRGLDGKIDTVVVSDWKRMSFYDVVDSTEQIESYLRKFSCSVGEVFLRNSLLGREFQGMYKRVRAAYAAKHPGAETFPENRPSAK